jgi:hypothetical protein
MCAFLLGSVELPLLDLYHTRLWYATAWFGLLEVSLEDLDEFVGGLVGVFAVLGFDDVMDEVVGHEFGHEGIHPPACGGDELQDVNTFGVVVVQSAFDGVHLSTDAAQASVEFIALLEHVSHSGYCTPVGISLSCDFGGHGGGVTER